MLRRNQMPGLAVHVEEVTINVELLLAESYRTRSE